MTGAADIEPDERLVRALCAAAETEPGEAETAVRAHLRRLAPLAGPGESERLVRAAVARLDGLGMLDALLHDEAVDEVLVNAGGEIWVDCRGDVRRHGRIGEAELTVVIERILAPLGRRLDRTMPIVDARLADGTRVCAVVPPISLGGTSLSLRRFRSTPLPLSAFASPAVAGVLADVIRRRCNVVVSGATSSGKTSLLTSLIGLVEPAERVVSLEDTAELAPRIAHHVRLESRPATADGVAEISLDQLLRTALRLRPDRLVVGEVRGGEILSLIQALNTGHDGSLSTVHANSATDALRRLETLVLQSAPTWPLAAIRSHLVRCLDIVVHVERTDGARRRVAEVGEVVADGDGDDGDGVPTVRRITIVDDVVGDLRRTRRWERR